MKYFIAILSLVLIVSCKSTPPFEPVTVQATGDYQQFHTGLTFPESVVQFKRTSITQFDSSGSNIGIGYNLDSKKIAVTIYSYPAPKVSSFGSPENVIKQAEKGLFDNVYHHNKQAIMTKYQDARLISESGYQPPQVTTGYMGMQSSFAYTGYVLGQKQLVKSYLYLIQFEGKHFKYRITHPDNVDAKMEIEQLIKKLNLVAQS